MKKYLFLILMAAAFALMLCGCGGDPLEKAYDSLSKAQSDQAGDRSEYVTEPVSVDYDQDNSILQIEMEPGSDVDMVFETLNKDIEGEDVGTIIFRLTGYDNDTAKAIDEKIGDLSCASMERVGISMYIADADTDAHKWLKVTDKTDKLYLESVPTVLYDYSDKDKKKLGKFVDVREIYHDTMDFGGLDLLTGTETLSFIPYDTYSVEAKSDDPLANVTEDNPYLNGSDSSGTAETETSEAAEVEGSDAAFDPVEFTFAEYTASNLESIGMMDSLKTLLIYPDTGYELSTSGQTFIKSLSFMNKDLMVNPPGEAYSEDGLVAVSDIKTPDLTDEQVNAIIEKYLKYEVEGVYKECKKYKDAKGDAVLTGNSLIYEADPSESEWSGERKFTTSGNVRVADPAKKGIKVPMNMGDYDTFVYIYPTFTRTGVYTSGTKAYSQTLHVKVYNMKDKVAYEAKTVGTAAAPQSFSYFAGSVPDKHSGEVDIKKAYDYLKKLKTQ